MKNAAAKIKEWRDDPAKFAWDMFQFEPDPWQAKVLRKFPSQRPAEMRQAMKACAGPGKSALLAICGWNFLTCYATKGDHPKGAVVSVTSSNLSDNLWAEFAKWRSRSPFLLEAFEWTKTRVFAKDHPETWFLSARSWSKTADAEEQGRVLSGLHSKYVLYLIDESGDIPPAVLRAAEQGLSNCTWGKIVQAGNPTSTNGMLYLAATSQRDMWDIITITGDPDDPMRSTRIDIDWARGQIDKYGRDNPWVQAYILGEFPPSSLNTLLGPEEVEAAMARHLREDEYSFSQQRIGVDVARFGDDRTIIFPRRGLAAGVPVEMRGARSNDVAARVMTIKKELRSEMEMVDGTGGYGSGVIDAMLLGGAAPLEVSFSGRAIDPRYYNKRTEMWFLMAEWIKRGGALPRIPELIKELTAPTYTFRSGKMLLEEKDQIKQRIGTSPDYADALALTFALPEMPQSFALPGMPHDSAKLLYDYDPYAESRI